MAKLGIEKLKQVVGLVVAFGQKIESTTADGFQVADLFQFIGEFAQIPDVVKSKDEIMAEFNDLDTTERAELTAFVENSLNLKNKKVEGIIEAAFGLAISILDVVSKIKAANEAPPATPTAL
jgi:hypothetical protein